MATPAVRIDETKGLSLVSGDGDQRDLTRYIFTALDAIDPDRKYQISTVREGGEEVASRCLRRTPNYIPRCEFTPVEKWFEPLGIRELAGDRMQDLVRLNTPPPAVPDQFNPTSFFRRNEEMWGLPHYPGVDLPLILEVSGYRGVKEIENLRGIDWETGEIQELQKIFFPEKLIPFRLLEEQVQKAGQGDLRLIAEELLLSIDHSRRWALTRIGVEHGLLQTRVKHDHTYTYSRLAPQLLAQLEMEPKDVGTETSRFAKEIVKELLAAQQVTQSTVNIESIVEQAVKAALVAHGVGVERTTEPEPESTTCPKCGTEFTSLGGVRAHSKNCKGK